MNELSMYHFYDLHSCIGRPPYPPRILSRITLFGHMIGITGGRAIEQACLYDLRFK
ncbi:transposase [Fusibacter sp. A1]|uniref:transposase n=1 Tax=Fusibacter sp. A1 TaxID=2283630 RepID=UPI001011BD18|nr:transposase [Fusibacter sp. A1]